MIIPKNPSVFISYTNKDVNIAESIAVELVNVGINVWFDKWRILGGDSILDSVDEAINKCEIFIVILSRNAMKSPWVRKETNLAFSILLQKSKHRKFKLVPIRIDNCKIPSRFQDIHILNYSSKPEIFLPKIVPIIDAELQLEPNPIIQSHSREQSFNKAISVLRLQPNILRTTLVGPIFLYSKSMVKAKQNSDKEKRPSFSKAMQTYLLTQQQNPNKNISLVIKLIPRYEKILNVVSKTLDIESEINRMKKELNQYIPDDDASGIKVAVSKEFQYAFFVTDKILIEAERYLLSDKMHSGWSTTQPLAIKQKTEMFDSSFQQIYKNNRHSKQEIINFLDDFVKLYK